MILALSACDELAVSKNDFELHDTKKGVLLVDTSSGKIFTVGDDFVEEVVRINQRDLSRKLYKKDSVALKEMDITIRLKYRDGKVHYIATITPKLNTDSVEASVSESQTAAVPPEPATPIDPDWGSMFDSSKPEGERAIKQLNIGINDADDFELLELKIEPTKYKLRLVNENDGTTGYEFAGSRAMTPFVYREIAGVSVGWNEYP